VQGPRPRGARCRTACGTTAHDRRVPDRDPAFVLRAVHR
jgi:hypothetical protein